MVLQERQVRQRLTQDFEPLIDMRDVSRHNESEQAKMRASRALAAMSVAANAKLSVEEACASIVDESGDAGIDAVGVSLFRDSVYLIQAKTSKGSPSPTEVMKFVEGIRRVLDGDWESLGPKLRKRQDEIEEALNNCRIVAIFSHLGVVPPNEDAIKISKRLVEDTNSAGDLLEFHYEGLKDNYAHRNIANGLTSPDFELTFDRWVTLNHYRSEIMGIVRGGQLAHLVDSFESRIFDKNIRSILKKNTDTNESLRATLRCSPGNFWYYNNGITVVANSISCERVSPRAVNETFILKGLSVVNGAQTCGALAEAWREGRSLDDVFVTVRVIATASANDHPADFEKLVTRYTNTQNQVTSREFVSLDPYQEELREILRSECINYSYRTGDDADDEDFKFSFGLEEATRALACFTSVDHATRAKREIGRMWSDIKSAPYTELFSRQLDAAVMYNVVRFWRAFNATLSGISESMGPREKRIALNSNHVCCALLMESYQKEGRFSQIETDIEAWVESQESLIRKVVDSCVDLHEKMNPGGYPLSFFKNQQKIEEFARELRSVVFEEV